MKRIYWSALSFSLGVIVWRIISNYFFEPASTSAFSEDFHVIFAIFIFAFLNRKLEVDKQRLDEVEQISNQLAREVVKLNPSIGNISNLETEKELNFFKNDKVRIDKQ